MEMERVNERKRKEIKEERRKGLILYLIIFSNYLLIMILWKDMAQWNGNGTRQRKKKNGNKTRTS